MWSSNNEWAGPFANGLATQLMTSSEIDLQRFHSGDRKTLTQCYEDHFEDVYRAVGTVLQGADRETVVHEVFLALLDNADLRQNFQGGSLGAWLRTVARNRAIDHHRRFIERERPLPSHEACEANGDSFGEASVGNQLDAKRFLERIRTAIPDKWLAVFEARFIKQLSQQDAAISLNTHRTTLAYQELQIRRIVRRVLKESRAA